MAKHSKFIFQDLPKAQVVNLNYNFDMDSHKDDLINHAITQHLNTIVNLDDNPNSSDNPEIKDEEEVIVDLEVVKRDSYHQGLDDAKQQYETVINDLQSENKFIELFKQKISEISTKSNIDVEIAKLASEIIINIIKKIYLILPVDFEKVLKVELLEKLKKFYKEGHITLTIHSSRYELCKNILNVENLPVKLKENFEIIKDDNLNKNDCNIQWQDTSLKYDQEQLNSEIDKILDQLKGIA